MFLRLNSEEVAARDQPRVLGGGGRQIGGNVECDSPTLGALTAIGFAGALMREIFTLGSRIDQVIPPDYFFDRSFKWT
jgi:hypothetical protein